MSELNLGFVQKNVAGQLSSSRQLLEIYRQLKRLADDARPKDPAVADQLDETADKVFQLANKMVTSASEMGTTVAKFITNQ